MFPGAQFEGCRSNAQSSMADEREGYFTVNLSLYLTGEGCAGCGTKRDGEFSAKREGRSSWRRVDLLPQPGALGLGDRIEGLCRRLDGNEPLDDRVGQFFQASHCAGGDRQTSGG